MKRCKLGRGPVSRGQEEKAKENAPDEEEDIDGIGWAKGWRLKGVKG